jgi:hypothetical protein
LLFSDAAHNGRNLSLEIRESLAKNCGLLRYLLVLLVTCKAPFACAERWCTAIKAEIAATSMRDIALSPVLAIHPTFAYPIWIKFLVSQLVPEVAP